jgi:hypothetical protein
MIRYTLPKSTRVSVEIIGMSGARLGQIMQFGHQQAGMHTEPISLPGTWPAGIYILKLSTDAGTGSIRFEKL